MKRLLAIALAATTALPATAQDAPAPVTPTSIVNAAPASDWRAIDPADLLVMTLAPDAAGQPRVVVIQLIPAPFSQGWVGNIRTLAKAHWWDGTTVYRVVDNWVSQWGDGEDNAANAKPLPAGVVSPTQDYWVDVDALSDLKPARDVPALSPEQEARLDRLAEIVGNPLTSEAAHEAALTEMLSIMGLAGRAEDSPSERIARMSIDATQTLLTEQGWHERDGHAEWVELWNGWPIANQRTEHWEDESGNVVPASELPNASVGTRYFRFDDEGEGDLELADEERYTIIETSVFWPIHCYASVGVARDLAPDTGTGAELYTVIGHAPRQLDRNIAVVGRVIEGIEHLSALPRGKGEAGVYDDPKLRVPIVSVRLGNELPAADRPRFEYLATDSESFARYLTVFANRDDPFYRTPSRGFDVCNAKVPIRRVKP